MNVYIGTSGELKNAYIGEYVPSIFQYFYDFRGKTWSQCQTDGWFSNTGTPTMNSDGITADAWSVRPIISFGNDGEVFNNATKITIEWYFKVTVPSSYALASRLQKAADTNANTAGFYLNQNFLEAKFNESTTSTVSSSGWSGWKTLNLVYDLTNSNFGFSGACSLNGSITSANNSMIKTLSQLKISLGPGITVGTVSVTIE